MKFWKYSILSLFFLLSIWIIFGAFNFEWFIKNKKRIKLLPSYVSAVRGNSVSIYAEVKGSINNFDDDIIKQTNAKLLAFKSFFHTERKQEPVVNHLNYHIWNEICFPVIENLIYNPTFPDLPSKSLYIDTLKLKNIGSNSGIRVFGYIKITQTKKYKFWLYTRNSVATVWLSRDEKVTNSKLFIQSHLSEQNVFSNFSLKTFTVI